MIIEPIINMHKLKYKILTQLVDTKFTKGEEINIFINLDSIFSSLYKPNIVEGIRDMEYLNQINLSSEVINIMAHYRHFFWKYYGVPSNFYLYFMNKQPKNSAKHFEKYALSKLDLKSKDNDRFGTLNEYINTNMRLISLISLYTQQCYCLASDGVEPALIPYHIIQNTNTNKVCNLILTKDKNDLQLLSLDNTYILNLKYDDSHIISDCDLYDYILKDVKYRPSNDVNIDLYSFVSSFAGMKSRDIPTLKGYGKVNVMKRIDKAISSGEISNKYSRDIETLCEAIGADDVSEKVSRRFKALDLRYNYNILSNAKKEDIDLRIADRYDNSAIMEINDKYYRNNPIHLIELCEGVRF